jgi:hypothetical protein
MPAAAAEKEDESRLEDFDLEGSPPCGILHHGQHPRCGKKSVIRVRFFCGNCGNACARFLCRDHYRQLLLGEFCCHICKTRVNQGFRWEVI